MHNVLSLNMKQSTCSLHNANFFSVTFLGNMCLLTNHTNTNHYGVNVPQLMGWAFNSLFTIMTCQSSRKCDVKTDCYDMHMGLTSLIDIFKCV